MLSRFLIGSMFFIPETIRLVKSAFGVTTTKGLFNNVDLTHLFAATAAESTPRQNAGDNIQPESPSGLVNPLGEPLNTASVDLGSGPKQNSGIGSSGVSSVKPRCEIGDLSVVKSNTGEDFGYITAGANEKYGEVIYEHTIYPPDVMRIKSTGRPEWGFLLVEKLPRWRKIVRGIAGFVTLIGGTVILMPLGPIPAAIISGAAAIGVRKLFTLGRSVHFEAETADLHLTNGYAPKRDYDIFKRLVREATHKAVNEASVCFQN